MTLKIGIIIIPNLREEDDKDELISLKSPSRTWLRTQPIAEQHLYEKNGKLYTSCGYYLKSLGHTVDFILPHETTRNRCAKSDLVFTLIYDILESFHTTPMSY